MSWMFKVLRYHRRHRSILTTLHHVRAVSIAMPASLKRLATEDGSVSPPPTKRKVITSTTNTAVANFFKPASQKEPEKTVWRTIDDTLLVCKYEKLDPSADEKPKKIAAFDFDSTLISSASGKKFAQGAEDWKWWNPQVPARLKELSQDGYIIVILSNQGGISLDPKSKTAKSDQRRLKDFKQKVNTILHQLDLPISLYAATGRDKYRKPRAGMWDTLLSDRGLKPEDVDVQASLFVGDAGGRTHSGKLKADFSCSDRDLASNVGINFHTPEEFFLKEEPRPFVRVFDPSIYLAMAIQEKTPKVPVAFTKKHPLELVIFCGSPGAGKSTFFWHHLKPLGYERVNQDILGSRKACIQAATQFLKEGSSVAVDNTNADIDTRAHWIDLAKTFEIPVRCVHFTASAKLCEHNDAVRALGGIEMNPEQRTGLPKVAFTGFSSRYREPTLTEGFEDIFKVDFLFSGTAEQKSLWGKFWI